MSKEDYYETLGVGKSSSEAEIKQAYRKKAMRYHPDKNKGDKESEKEYVPFIVNRGLGFFQDTVLLANEMNYN